MKRILISILISFSFLAIGFSILFGLETMSVISEETSFNLATPVRLPVYIYEDILGYEIPYSESDEDLTSEEMWGISLAILFNVIMYAIIIYCVIGLIKKFKRKEENDDNHNPPEPPIFN